MTQLRSLRSYQRQKARRDDFIVFATLICLWGGVIAFVVHAFNSIGLQ